jgi:4-hydroxyphenylpyruvate dioxygenase
MGGALEDKLASAAKAGFRAVEIFENDLTSFRGKPRDPRLLAADLGLAIVALQPLLDFEAMLEPTRARNFERAARKLDLMDELGTRLLCVCSNVSPDAVDNTSRAAEDLAELADLARQRGMRIGYEALAWGRWVKDWTVAWEIVRAADRDNLGIVLDSFHICVRRNPIEPIASLPADKIALVQVADAPALVMDPLSLSRHYRCYPGQGDYPIAEYLDAVTRSGYRGPLSLEIFNDQFRGASTAAIAIDGMRSLRAVGERLAASRAARGLAPLADLPPLPPAPAVERAEFLEFAAGDAVAGELTALIEGLGFRCVGRHRSKDVDLFSQGGINREREGFAHSFSLLHGPAVCAIALRVDSVEKALERASALECQSYLSKIGVGEATVPAVAGVEGSLIYFVGSATRRGAAISPLCGARPRGAFARDRSSLQRCAPRRISELVAVLRGRARARASTASRDRRSARRVFQPPPAQSEWRVALGAQRRRGRRNWRLPLPRRLRRWRLPADRAFDG